MFLPFLPHLIALAGAAALTGLEDIQPHTGHPVYITALVYAALPVLGLMLGHLPSVVGGPRGASGLSRRRILLLGFWFWGLSLTNLPQNLATLGWPSWMAREASIWALLLNFWIADGLALHPYAPWKPALWRAQAGQLAASLRLPLPLVLLSALAMGFHPLADWSGLLPDYLEPLVFLSLMLLTASMLMPWLVRVCWGLKPLHSERADAVVRAELAANGVRVADVLSWPDYISGVATAGVIGLFPRLRFLLMSNSLAQHLEEDELRAVTAHEAAHLRYHHLWYLLGSILGFLLLVQTALTLLFWFTRLSGDGFPLWVNVALELAALLLFLRFGMGYVSRAFERQADGNACRSVGLEPFRRAIYKVAHLNGIPVARDNWHHYGIDRRVEYLRGAEGQPETLPEHDRQVRRVKLALLVLLGAGILSQGVLFASDVQLWLAERALAHRADRIVEPQRKDLNLLNFMASRAMDAGNNLEARRYLNLILMVTPDDPVTLNNLAWIMVTDQNPPREDLEEGLRLAQMAILGSESAYIWDTLAEAHHRLGHVEQARQAAQRALVLAREGSGAGEAPLEYYQRRARELSGQDAGGKPGD
ncbi:MAG: M48 family metalloprotease [Deltaproteobacteria bacterium]|nr:M48 family metalloprotease [Deltaproteobacteria bacterium]